MKSGVAEAQFGVMFLSNSIILMGDQLENNHYSKTRNTILPLGVELEYKSLRDEILARIRLRQQIFWYTLTISGAFLGFGLTNPQVALIYPVIALFFAFGWVQNNHRIRNLATYIRKELEVYFDIPGWESSIIKKRQKLGSGSWRLVVISHGGTFFVTQIMAIGIGLSKIENSQIKIAELGSFELTFLIVDIIAIVCVIYVIIKRTLN